MAQTRHYVIPFAVFLGLTFIGSKLPSHFVFPVYMLKTFLVGGLLFCWRRHYQELYTRISLKEILLACITGLAVLVVWVGGEGLFPKIGTPSDTSPLAQGASSLVAFSWIAARIFGAVIVVPIMEELFWRSFLMRYLIDKDFQKVPLGAYTHFSFWVTALLFALEHFRVVPGFFAGVVYGGLLCYTHNLWVPILSHMVTNLGLAIYVLITHQWQFW
ncbi:CAAX prenyl protease-related protein [Thermodesulfatator atlanticus]